MLVVTPCQARNSGAVGICGPSDSKIEPGAAVGVMRAPVEVGSPLSKATLVALSTLTDVVVMSRLADKFSRTSGFFNKNFDLSMKYKVIQLSEATKSQIPSRLLVNATK